VPSLVVIVLIELAPFLFLGLDRVGPTASRLRGGVSSDSAGHDSGDPRRGRAAV